MGIDPLEVQQKLFAEMRADARFAYDLHFKGVVAHMPAIISLGIEAIKSAILINGGTAAALLTFLGKERLLSQPNILWALKIFAIGLIIGAAASVLAYSAQLMYGTSDVSMSFHTDHPYIRQTTRSKRLRKLAIATHVASVVCVVVSFICAAGAFYNVGASFTEISLPPPVSPR